MKSLIIAEHVESAAELSVAAREFVDEVVGVGLNVRLSDVADKSYIVSVPEDRIVEDAWVTINAIVDSEAPNLILVEPTVTLGGLAARVAAHLGCSVVTDVIALTSNSATSLYFGGTGERSVAPLGGKMVCTVSRGLFDGANAHGTDEVAEVAFEDPEKAVIRLGVEAIEKSSVNLSAADVVIGAGRGFAEESQLSLAYDLATKINGEVGCTRPLSEGTGWMPTESYIGVSGQMLAPKVYVGIGASGQMQHMVGVNRANTIFAINKDKNAPIFKQCDFGIVGDLNEVLPALISLL